MIDEFRHELQQYVPVLITLAQQKDPSVSWWCKTYPEDPKDSIPCAWTYLICNQIITHTVTGSPEFWDNFHAITAHGLQHFQERNLLPFL